MSERVTVDWDRILPDVIHKAFNTSSAIVGYLDMADRTQDTEKISRFIREARNGMTEIENVFFELGHLAGKYQFEMDSFPLDLSLFIDDKISIYDNLILGNMEKLTLTGDHELVGLILDLLLRIASSNLLSEHIGTIKLAGRELTITGTFASAAPEGQIDGRWGYERELLQRLVGILDYKLNFDKGEISLEMADNGQT